MSMLDEALGYAEGMGWPVFPCNNVKTPLTPSGVLDATTDLAKIKAWWTRWPNANIGFHVGAAGMMAVDLDNGHDMAEVHRIFGGLPPTKLVQRTPSGGTHHFYSLNAGEQVRPSASKVAKDVDIRSHNSYVLLSPSVTIQSDKSTAGAYTWDHETAGQDIMPKPSHRTDQMVLVSGAVRAKSSKADVWIIEPDLPENIKAAGEWINSASCNPAVMGEGGDTMTYRTAGMMRSYGLSEEMAATVMLGLYNAKCDPPWEADEIEAPIRNAYRYATSEPGNLTDAYKKEKLEALYRAAKEIKVVRVAKGEGAKLRPGLYNGTDFGDRPPIKWLIDGWVEQASYSIASARSQAGKTFNELALALSIATGLPWHGKEIAEPGPAVYIASEGFGRVQLDMAAWCQFHGLDPATALQGKFFAFDGVTRLNTPEGVTVLAEIMEDVHAIAGRYPTYIVIDTLRRNMRGGVSKEEPTSDVLTAIDDLRRRYHVAVTLVAHHGRGHDETKGLTDWEDDADQVRKYAGEVRKNNTVLEFFKIKAGEGGMKLKITYNKVELPSGKSTLVATADGAPTEEDDADVKAKYSMPDYDREAKSRLDAADGLGLTRGELATAVVAGMTPEYEGEPLMRRKFYMLYYKRLGRVGKDHALSSYVSQRNDKQEPTHFRNPNHNGRRVRASVPRGATVH